MTSAAAATLCCKCKTQNTKFKIQTNSAKNTKYKKGNTKFKIQLLVLHSDFCCCYCSFQQNMVKVSAKSTEIMANLNYISRAVCCNHFKCSCPLSKIKCGKQAFSELSSSVSSQISFSSIFLGFLHQTLTCVLPEQCTNVLPAWHLSSHRCHLSQDQYSDPRVLKQLLSCFARSQMPWNQSFPGRWVFLVAASALSVKWVTCQAELSIAILLHTILQCGNTDTQCCFLLQYFLQYWVWDGSPVKPSSVLRQPGKNSPWCILAKNTTEYT